MYTDGKIWVGQSDKKVCLLPGMANRHGLIAGATGTGKTITLKILAESFSSMGVPVFLADIKGDLASISRAGEDSTNMQERIKRFGIENFKYQAFPVQLWDLFGEGGIPIRTTVSDMGSLLLSRILGLNETQEGVLNIIFRIADDKGMLLIDLKDLRAMIQYVGDHAKEYTLDYGNISTTSVGAILRSLIGLEDQGGEYFFGEPMLDLTDFIKTTPDGRGIINILHSVRLYQSPALYSTFLLWLLSELFELLPEAGDLEKPKMVFFFDEAHLLFDDAPKILLSKIEQVVRLIRSKGVGIYFVTQSPNDLPDSVLSQLGNRIQHALRAFTPADAKKVKTAADTFRQNPAFDTQTAITELATGEALISCLDEKGSPSIVERAFILPPQSKFGTIEDVDRKSLMMASPMKVKYEKEIDRESAFELIRESRGQEAKKVEEEINKKEEEKATALADKEQEKAAKEQEKAAKEQAKADAKAEALEAKAQAKKEAAERKKKSVIEKAASTTLNSIGRELGKSLIRGILGSLKK